MVVSSESNRLHPPRSRASPTTGTVWCPSLHHVLTDTSCSSSQSLAAQTPRVPVEVPVDIDQLRVQQSSRDPSSQPLHTQVHQCLLALPLAELEPPPAQLRCRALQLRPRLSVAAVAHGALHSESFRLIFREENLQSRACFVPLPTGLSHASSFMIVCL